MEKSKIVLDLLESAKQTSFRTPQLNKAISDLSNADDEVNGNSIEYKNLKTELEKVVEMQARKKQSVKIDTAGIKQFGREWYSVKNKSRLFKTVEECAKAMN